MSNPFRYFSSSPEVIRLVVMMYVRYPLSLRNVEDLLAERGIGLCQSNGRSSARGATRPPSSDIQAARARHSANVAERLCL